MSAGAWFAIEAVVVIGTLGWLWRWMWALERSGEATPLARQRALIGFVIVVLLIVARWRAWGWWP